MKDHERAEAIAQLVPADTEEKQQRLLDLVRDLNREDLLRLSGIHEERSRRISAGEDL